MCPKELRALKSAVSLRSLTFATVVNKAQDRDMMREASETQGEAGKIAVDSWQ